MYPISDRIHSRIVVAALDSAAARRSNIAGCVLHSDRGSQFRARRVTRTLKRHDTVGSIDRVGAAGDNAAMESFLALLQNNVLNRQTWDTRDELRIAIVTWIERTYHRRRQNKLHRIISGSFPSTGRVRASMVPFLRVVDR